MLTTGASHDTYEFRIHYMPWERKTGELQNQSSNQMWVFPHQHAIRATFYVAIYTTKKI